MQPSVQVRRSDPPVLAADTLAVVPDALVPMLWWPDVPVLRDVRHELTALERFVLETGLTLGAVTAAEFSDVTGLPAQVLHGVCAGLVSAGALQPGGNGYAVVAEVAGPAADSGTLTRQTHTTGAFVLLPRHGDVLGMPAGGGWLGELVRRRPRPVTGAPVSRELWETGRDRFLAERVKSGAVAGADPDLVAVVPAASDVPLLPSVHRHGVGMCPAYRVRAQVTGVPGERYAVHAAISGAAPDGAGGTGRTVEVAADLTGANGLVRDWMSLADLVAEPAVLHAAWQELAPPAMAGQPPPPVRRRGPVEWEFPVDGITAAALSAHGDGLTRPVGLEVEGDAAVVRLACWFVRDDRMDLPPRDATRSLDDATALFD